MKVTSCKLKCNKGGLEFTVYHQKQIKTKLKSIF